MKQFYDDRKSVVLTDAVLRQFRVGMTVRQMAQSADGWLGNLMKAECGVESNLPLFLVAQSNFIKGFVRPSVRSFVRLSVTHFLISQKQVKFK